MYLIPYPSHVRQNIAGALCFAAPTYDAVEVCL